MRPVEPVLIAPGHVAGGGGHHLAQVRRLVVLVKAELGLQAEHLPSGQEMVLGHVYRDVVKIPLEVLTLQPVPEGESLGDVTILPNPGEQRLVPPAQ